MLGVDPGVCNTCGSLTADSPPSKGGTSSALVSVAEEPVPALPECSTVGGSDFVSESMPLVSD